MCGASGTFEQQDILGEPMKGASSGSHSMSYPSKFHENLAGDANGKFSGAPFMRPPWAGPSVPAVQYEQFPSLCRTPVM
jgi:hypothetical protein